MSINADMQAVAGREMIQGAFKKFGCELGSVLAEEVVTSGIYVLMDAVTGQFYVGQSIDIDARYKQHLDEAKRKAKSAWKATSTIIARFPIPGIDTALDKAEQLVMDILEKEGQKLLNGRKQIGPGSDSLRDYKRFKKVICPKL